MTSETWPIPPSVPHAKKTREDLKKWTQENGYTEGDSETLVLYISQMFEDLGLMLIDPSGMGLSAVALLEKFEKVYL